MISSIFLSITISFITMVFSFFPQVDVLPTILGVDLDSIIVGGISNLMRIAEAFWYITDVFQGFFYITGYLIIKQTLKQLAGVLKNFGGAAIH